MSPSSRNQKVRREDISKFEEALDALPQQQSAEIGKAEAVRLLLPKIRTLLGKGHSLVQIAAHLTQAGLPITANLLRTCLVREGDARPKKRNRRSGATARAQRNAPRAEGAADATVTGAEAGTGNARAAVPPMADAPERQSREGGGAASESAAVSSRTQPSSEAVASDAGQPKAGAREPASTIKKEHAVKVLSPVAPRTAADSEKRTEPAAGKSYGNFVIKPDTKDL